MHPRPAGSARSSETKTSLRAQFNTQLGHGAFKEVFKGYDEEEGNEIAWCQVVMDRIGETEKAQIRTEVELLKGLTHQNILTFIDSGRLGYPPTSKFVYTAGKGWHACFLRHAYHCLDKIEQRGAPLSPAFRAILAE